MQKIVPLKSDFVACINADAFLIRLHIQLTCSSLLPSRAHVPMKTTLADSWKSTMPGQMGNTVMVAVVCGPLDH
jgi:hypothetical protein